MAVHRISLAGALLFLLVALVLFVWIGSVGLLVLVLVGILLWWAIGPGSRASGSSYAAHSP
jgi:hypothetical protein